MQCWDIGHPYIFNCCDDYECGLLEFIRPGGGPDPTPDPASEPCLTFKDVAFPGEIADCCSDTPNSETATCTSLNYVCNGANVVASACRLFGGDCDDVTVYCREVCEHEDSFGFCDFLPDEDGERKKLPGWAIALIVIGTVALIVVIAILIVKFQG
jgi:hypothetical protein